MLLEEVKPGEDFFDLRRDVDAFIYYSCLSKLLDDLVCFGVDLLLAPSNHFSEFAVERPVEGKVELRALNWSEILDFVHQF